MLPLRICFSYLRANTFSTYISCVHAGAISKNPLTRSITESDFQVEVVRFLKGAVDQNGGRKVRAARSEKRKEKRGQSRSLNNMEVEHINDSDSS